MNRCSRRPALLMPIIVFLFMLSAVGVHADTPVVRAVFFYSPSCGHCHKVITEDLPPLFEKYGDRLQIVGVNTADPTGGALFNAAADRFNVSPENRGVPFLVIADVVLIGSLDIPQQLPGLIEKHLAAGGVDWPDIPGLAEVIAQSEVAQRTATPPTTTAQPPTPTPVATLLAPTLMPTRAPTATRPTPTSTSAPGIVMVGGTTDSGVRARFDRDPVGNGLAILVLAGMLAAIGWVVAQ